MQNNWHYPRPLLAKKYLDLFDMGLTSARGLFARRRMGKTEFLKKDFIPAAEKAGYLVGVAWNKCQKRSFQKITANI